MTDPKVIDDSISVPVCPLPGPDQEPRAGDPCPSCRAGILDYNSLLNLACPECGYTQAGCFS